MRLVLRLCLLLLILAPAAGVPSGVTVLAQGGPRGPMDFSGEWAPLFQEDFPERIPGPDIGDYLGLPINEAARQHADAWDASILTLPEHQCKPHPADYSPRGPANLRIWREYDRATQALVAIHTHISWQQPERTIWMDGRPHPPAYAAHTWQGFSTGVFDGDMLTITTTHLKMGWIRRNGVPRSDTAVLTEHLVRHGDYLTLIAVINDPVYLTEPFVRTTNWALDPHQVIQPYPCQSVVEVERPQGIVPNHLPGQNSFLREFAAKFHLPFEPTRGGAETMYPEYVAKIQGTTPVASARTPVAIAAPLSTQAPAAVAANTVQTLHVQGNVYMLVGAGGNIAAQIGDEGVLLVDTGTAQVTSQVVAALRALTDKPIRYIINTSADADHVGGNDAIGRLGSTIAGGNVGAGAGVGAGIIAHENVQRRMSAPTGKVAPYPQTAWPTDTFVSRQKDLYFNGESIQVIYQPGHTDGDAIVYFRRSDVIVAGELFNTLTFPIVDASRGGSIQGVLAGLNNMLDIAIPTATQDGGTYIIPGRGRLTDEADLLEYRDMVTIVRDRVQDGVKRGLTLDQVKAGRPTLDYDARWSATSGPWTTGTFLEAIYNGLSKASRPGK